MKVLANKMILKKKYLLREKLVLIFAFQFQYASGGITTLYNLCRALKEHGINAKIWCCESEIENNICMDFYNKALPINPINTIAIYPEVIKGNPIGAAYVIRWILGPFANPEIRITWNNNDYVYFHHSDIYFDSDKIFSIDKGNHVYKYLALPYTHPAFKNAVPIENRVGYCHVTRKAQYYGITDLTHHPADSIEIHDMEQAIVEFSKRKFSVCYDPLTFYSIAAPICGCISIIINHPNITRKSWIDKTCLSLYFKNMGHYDLYGVAYGDSNEEIEYALRTVHLAKKQWEDMTAYICSTTLLLFVKDLQLMPILCNNVKQVFM